MSQTSILVPGEAASLAGPLPALTAHGRALDPSRHRLGLITPTSGDASVATIRERLHGDGHVWLKGLLDRRTVQDFRARALAELRGGLAAPAAADGEGETLPARSLVDRRLMALVRSAAFEGFCMQPRLVALMDKLLGGLSYLHKRKLMRYTRAGDGSATPAHYDLIYLRGGTDRLVTVWIPIGDTPVAMGGLCYLEGSHAIGVRMEADFAARAGDLSPEERINAYNRNMAEGGWISKDLPDMASRFDARWLVADYEAGDVMLHSPYMVHASTTNEDPERRIRLSTDIRYQNVEDEIDARWNNHWSLDDML